MSQEESYQKGKYVRVLVNFRFQSTVLGIVEKNRKRTTQPKTAQGSQKIKFQRVNVCFYIQMYVWMGGWMDRWMDG